MQVVDNSDQYMTISQCPMRVWTANKLERKPILLTTCGERPKEDCHKINKLKMIPQISQNWRSVRSTLMWIWSY